MKCAIVIPAGAADVPLEELAGRTPLEAARLPTLDRLAAVGRMGTAFMVPSGFAPRSETALMSVLGYDPREYAAARGALEAAGRKLSLGRRDQVFRCNLVTIVEDQLRDFAAGYIRTAEAEPILAALNAALGEENSLRIHPGRSYRHLLVWKDAGPLPKLQTTPPEEALDQPAQKFWPRGAGAEPLRALLQRARELLAEHDINHVRRDLGENEATDVWVWGQGTLPKLPFFRQRFGVRGALIAGVDVMRGFARLVGWQILDVPGATGLLDTDYAAKGRAAVEALDKYDLVCVHVEAPDEAGHRGQAQEKIAALEAIDRDILAPLWERLQREAEGRLLVIPSHATPVARRRHADAPTIFVMAGAGFASHRGEAFHERAAAEGEAHLERGCDLMEYFLKR